MSPAKRPISANCRSLPASASSRPASSAPRSPGIRSMPRSKAASKRPFRRSNEAIMEPNQHRVPLEVEEIVPPGAPVATSPDLAPEPPATASPGPVDIGDVREKIVEALRTCFDPEVPVNIYEMGLIYDID